MMAAAPAASIDLETQPRNDVGTALRLCGIQAAHSRDILWADGANLLDVERQDSCCSASAVE